MSPGLSSDDGDPQQRELFAIRDVAEATGISPDTIRVWERRYGWPKPVRLPSGHRRYTGEQVRWLRRVAEALAHGHRPSHVLGLKEIDFDDLLQNLAPHASRGEVADRILEVVRDFREADLRELLMANWKQLGTDLFLDKLIAPLLNRTGRAWSDGTLQIRHEHFLSQVIEDVLRTARTSLDSRPGSPILVLTTLAGERHVLGLQMIALASAAHGVHPRLLGSEMPIEEIASAAREVNALAVGVSVSLATGGVETDRLLRDLRRQLPPQIRLLVGGLGARGVRRGPAGIDYAADFESFLSWLHSLGPALT